MYIIYKATNIINGKCYIGLTKQTLARRKYLHEWCARSKKTRSYFHGAIRKYGTDKFDWETLHSDIQTEQEVKSLEQHYIKLNESYGKGYNLTPGGDDFTSSNYQRENQLRRVERGEHPFTGGEIQRKSGLARSARGELEYLFEVTRSKVADGSHILANPETNPQKKRKREGRPHHNQKPAWKNTKVQNIQPWAIADQLYDWYQANKHKKRGSSYKAMSDEFFFKPSEVMVIQRKIKEGWIPSRDPAWLTDFG